MFKKFTLVTMHLTDRSSLKMHDKCCRGWGTISWRQEFTVKQVLHLSLVAKKSHNKGGFILYQKRILTRTQGRKWQGVCGEWEPGWLCGHRKESPEPEWLRREEEDIWREHGQWRGGSAQREVSEWWSQGNGKESHWGQRGLCGGVKALAEGGRD